MPLFKFVSRAIRATSISLLMVAALAKAETTHDSQQQYLCQPGKAGPFATLALLGRKEGVSREDFYSYWRDIHGMLATRIPGFWTYRQYHIDKEIESLRRLPEGYDKPLDKLEGFADVSFCSREDIAGLAGSAPAELIKYDEQNVFSYSYLYGAIPGDSLTLLANRPFHEVVETHTGVSLLMILAKPPQQLPGGFKASLKASLNSLSGQCQGLQRLRVNFFQPYDATAWPAPGVNHQPNQLMDAAVEFQFADRALAFSCLKGTHLAGQGGMQLVYGVDQRYAMVVDGKASLIGLRGLPAVQLINRMDAQNQKSEPVLKVLFGNSAQ